MLVGVFVGLRLMIGTVGGSVVGSIGAVGATSIGLVLVGKLLEVKKVGKGRWLCRM
jgi:hypothetical protein